MPIYTTSPRVRHASRNNSPSVVQELGREGILPYSWFFASSKPFNAPLAGLFAQYTISMALVIAPPPGDAYHFLINGEEAVVRPVGLRSFLISCTAASYSLTIVNMLVSVGLLLLHTQSYRGWGWNPPFQAPRLVILLYVLSNIFLVVVPFVPPVPGSRIYDHLPYWVGTMTLLCAFHTNFGAMNEPSLSYTSPCLGVCQLLGCCTGRCGMFGYLGEMGTGWSGNGRYRMTGCPGTCSIRCHRYDVLVGTRGMLGRRSATASSAQMCSVPSSIYSGDYFII